MEINGVNAEQTNKYCRLSKNDIIRMPSLNITRADFYHSSRQINTKHSKNYLKNLSTLTALSLTGLYIAHRNNLFNPIKREAKKILKSSELKEKVLNFVEQTVNNDTYTQTTKKFIENLTTDKLRPQDFIEEAQKILKDQNAFSELMAKVIKRLNDDPNTTTLKQGFAVDILDRLGVKIERNLTKAKNNGLPYKNQSSDIIESIFKKAGNINNTAEETLFESITNRSSSTIENFIKDSLIKTRLEKMKTP